VFPVSHACRYRQCDERTDASWPEHFAGTRGSGASMERDEGLSIPVQAVNTRQHFASIVGGFYSSISTSATTFL
jgi:hypothetical protein